MEQLSQSCCREQLADLVRRGYRFAYSLTHDAARADDLLQEAWLSVLKAGGSWAADYLLVAIRSRFCDQCRRDGLVAFSPLTDEIADALTDRFGGDGELSDTSDIVRLTSATPREPPGMDDSDDVWVDLEKLDRALARLRPEERAVLFLAAVEERSAQDIGDLLGWPRGTVLSLLHRSRGKLREWLGCGPGART